MNNYLNQNVKNKNSTEILKSTIYAPDNYLLRSNKESELFVMVEKQLLQKISEYNDIKFDMIK